MSLFDTLGLLLVSILLGGMIFFPAVVAPAVFKNLDEARAGAFLRGLFPRYYTFIIILSILSAGAFYADLLLVSLILVIAFSTLLVRQVLVPKINAWRDVELAGDAAAGQRFAVGHRASVIINMLQMLVVLGVIGTVVSSGLVA